LPSDLASAPTSLGSRVPLASASKELKSAWASFCSATVFVRSPMLLLAACVAKALACQLSAS
jgi:hypothetical protein